MIIDNEALSADDASELLSVAKAAQIANVSVSTMRKWIDTGPIHALRYGRVIRIPRKCLDEFMAEHTF